MLQRRLFVGCALCSIGGLVAAEVAAQAPAAPGAAGVRRKILQQTEGPMPGYVTVAVEIEIDAGVLVARHTHPRHRSSTYAMEGGGQLQVDGKPALPVREGVASRGRWRRRRFQNGDKATKLAATFVVEKGKPLASPA